MDTFTLQANVGWNWFSFPEAIHYDGTHDKTYFGYVTNTGMSTAASYDHDTGVTTTFLLHDYSVVKDDHDNPAVCVLNDGNIMYFCCAHGTSGNMRYRTTTTPEDISTLGAEQTLVSGLGWITYPLVFYHNPIIVLLYRVSMGTGARHWAGRVSKDNGATWGAEFEWLRYPDVTDQVYVRGDFRYGQNVYGSMIISNHPGPEHTSSDHNVYYCYLQVTDVDNIYIKSNLGAVLFDLNTPGAFIVPADLLVVHDSTVTGERAWVWDVFGTSSSYVYCVYATYENPPVLTNHRYNYARYNTGTFSFDIKGEICGGGGYIGNFYNASNHSVIANYSGGVKICKDGTADVVYCSRNVTGTIFEMWVYTSLDGGLTWTGAPITTGSGAVKNIRPITVLNPHPDMLVMWGAGTYTDYENWDFDCVGITDVNCGYAASTVAYPSIETTATAGYPSLVTASTAAYPSLETATTVDYDDETDSSESWYTR